MRRLAFILMAAMLLLGMGGCGSSPSKSDASKSAPDSKTEESGEEAHKQNHNIGVAVYDVLDD